MRETLSFGKDEEQKRLALSFIASATEKLKLGAEVRLYGTQGSIDDSVGQFTKMRGGIQRFLYALEFVVSSLVERTTRSWWEGFIIADVGHYSLSDVVVKVPIDSLWKPNHWWPIYHEVGHMISVTHKFIDEDSWQIRRFLTGKAQKNAWLRHLEEITADIICYLLGFFGNYNFYKKCYLQYYGIFSSAHDSAESIETITVRAFVVKTFVDLYVDPVITEEQFESDGFIYKRFLDFANELEPVLDSSRRYMKDKSFLAAEKCQFMQEILPWLKFIYMKCCQHSIIDSPLIGPTDIMDTAKLVKALKDADSSFALHIRKQLERTPQHASALNAYLGVDIPDRELMLKLLDIIDTIIINLIRSEKAHGHSL